MGVLANHVPSIEQLKPGLVEVIEEACGSKQFFRRFYSCRNGFTWLTGLSDSLWRIRNCSTKLGIKHQCCGGVPLGRF